MSRPIAIIGAPSSIGLRPYDDGSVRQVSRAPAVLRERGLIKRLRAVDLGDVTPPRYRDFEAAPGRARNEPELLAYSRSLGARISRALANGHFALVLGGDCSIVLGCLLAARRRAGTVGLAYVDGHADFETPEASRSGAASSMALRFAIGEGHSALAHLDGAKPLVAAERTAVIGSRDHAASHGHEELAGASILDIPSSELVNSADPSEAAERALSRIAAHAVGGFWIHVDADVLNRIAMPAVGSPLPGGLTPTQLLTLLTPLVADPRAIGLSLSIYDPALDPDRSGARQLVSLLTALFAPSPVH